MKYNSQNLNKCPICNEKAEITMPSTARIHISCSTCGTFDFYLHPKGQGHIESYPDDFNKLSVYLFYNNLKVPNSYIVNVIGSKYDFEALQQQNAWISHITDEMVSNWYPITFDRKIDLFLDMVWDKCRYMGDSVELSSSQLYSATFVNRFDPAGEIRDNLDSQAFYFLNYLKDNKYIDPVIDNKIKLLPEGLKRLDKIHKNKTINNKNVFVAMSFSKEMEDVREAIKQAIAECDYIPRIMDEIEHNHQIVPEMLYEIRQAKFLIAELTGHNNGAYFEAGYALGQNKEVIQLCREDTFEDDGHFDVKQINTILWKDCNDLTEKLINRIKATIE